MTKKDVWYFGYGSNLNIGQMMVRVGEWKKSAKAALKGYRLLFNVNSRRWGGMAANVENSGNHQDLVYGAIYLILESKLSVLTDYECIEPQSVMVESLGQQIPSKIYIFSSNNAAARPPAAYLNTMLEGLRQHGYEEEIIEKVKHIAKIHNQ